MKRLIYTLIIAFMATSLFAQESTGNAKVSVIENEDKTVVTIGSGQGLVIEDSQDTTKIKVGNKGVTIIEDEKGTEVEWSDLAKENEESDDSLSGEKSKKKFKPHWAAVEMGINNYLNNDFKMVLPEGAAYMDLNTGRSWNVNLNFLEYGLGFGTDKAGIVTGLGIEWSNYHFDQGNVIVEVDGDIIPFVLADQNSTVQRAKLQTTYLTAPLLLEFQIPAGKKRIHISGGVLGGVKIGSKTKMVYTTSGDKQKDKVKDDFNLSSLRYGFTARIGYKGLKLYANYYATSLFETNKGPELYPFAVGLTLLSF